MKKYYIYLFSLTMLSACSDFLDLQPEHQISDGSFYQNADDFRAALIGSYGGLQNLHSTTLVYLGELPSDNAEVRWTSPTVAEVELEEVNFTPANGFLNSVWSICFTTISRSNNILSRLDEVEMNEQTKNQFRGEALFLRAYSYFQLVRIFGPVPIVEVAFRSPVEIDAFDMSRKPVSEVYGLIVSDLNQAATLLDGVTGLSKSRASTGAAKTLLGKVYLTQNEFGAAENVLKEVIDADTYSLMADYQTLFTNGNDDLPESIFEVKYMSGNLGVGNNFSSIFTPARFDMDIFPNAMQGSGRVLPTQDIADTYEEGDLRRALSIGDSVLLNTGNYERELHGLKFVDFTTGVQGDGGINFTSLRYADVLLMYAEALNQNGKQDEALTYLNQVRDRAGLNDLAALSPEALALALEHERRVEFFLEGHRWFDLVRTGRLLAVMNDYFQRNNLSFRAEEHNLIMPIPLREIDINPNLGQNPGY